VQNSGFEYGTSHWTFYTDGTGLFSVDSAGPTISRAGHVGLISAGANVQLHQTGFPLEGNTRYRLAFQARSSTGHDCEVSLFKHTQPYTSYGLIGGVCDLDTSWRPFVFQFVTPVFSGTTADTRLMFWFGSHGRAGEEYWFDDIILEPMDALQTSVSAAGSEDDWDILGEFGLAQNYPNPFNPATTIRFTIAGVAALSGALSSGVEGPPVHIVRLSVYDLLGREVAVLVNEPIEPGIYQVAFDASGLASGVYLYRLSADGFNQTRRMILVR
jgi:hypothetical protein